MIDIKVEGLDELRRRLAGFSDRRFAAAIATGMTRTAAQTRDAVQAEAQRSLDRPTPYTLRQLRYVGATARRLVAGVGFNIEAFTDERGVVTSYRDVGDGQTPASKYLPPNIGGGQRAQKRMEVALQRAGVLPAGWYAVPGQGAPLNAYGNVNVGLVRQVLSQLRIEPTLGATSALPLLSAGDRGLLGVSASSLTPAMRSARKDALAKRNRISNAQKRAGGQFFAVPPGSKSRLAPGIWLSDRFSRKVAPIFIFVSSASYRPRFDFYGVARRTADRLAPQLIETAINDQIARLEAARKGGRS